MIRISLAAAAALSLLAGTALAQTTGQGLGIPRNVRSATPPAAATDGPAGRAPGPERNPDPWEDFNRKSYNFSMQLDRGVIGPAARTYKRALPQGVRDSIHNFVQNLGEPVVFVNDVLQGRLKSAGGTVARFAGNTTLGIAGLFDFVGQAGLPHHDNGFGITLGRYGVGTGPYLYVPVLGPTTVRDGVGSGVDSFTGPLTYIRFPGDRAISWGSTIGGGLDLRARVDSDLNQLETTATDPYATIRSAYLQNKQAQITGGDTQLETLPDFPDDPSQAAAPTTGGRPSRGPGRTGPTQPAPLPDFPDNPPNPPPPADAPRPGSGLSGLF